MHTFRYHAAQVRCRAIGTHGLMEVVYSGPIGVAAFDALREPLLRAVAGASALVVRLDGALMLMDALPDIAPGVNLLPSPPGAVVVRPDQFDMWSKYGRQLADARIKRVFFLDDQLNLALLWAERRAQRRD